MTQEELNTLFAQAGKVTAVEVIKERKSGESGRFAFVTMSEQTEAEQAIRMFNTYSLSDHALKVVWRKQYNNAASQTLGLNHESSITNTERDE